MEFNSPPLSLKAGLKLICWNFGIVCSAEVKLVWSYTIVSCQTVLKQYIQCKETQLKKDLSSINNAIIIIMITFTWYGTIHTYIYTTPIVHQKRPLLVHEGRLNWCR